MGLFTTKNIQTPLLCFDPVIWLMRNVLKIMKIEIIFFPDFYFLSYREKILENWGDDVTKIAKNKLSGSNLPRQELSVLELCFCLQQILYVLGWQLGFF